MRKILLFIVIIIIAYYAMFEMTEAKTKYVTIAFYSMSLLSSMSHLFLKI
jgi:hypothetical protein